MFNFASIGLPQKLALLVALPSSAVIVYLLWALNKDSDASNESEDVIQSRQTIIELKVPHDCVRPIIGREGSVIKEIQKITSTRIHFKDRERDPNDKQDRIMLIRGSSFNVQRAEMEVKRIIAETAAFLSEDIFVPSEYCGRIIGKGGNNIRTMCSVTGCKINVERGSSNKDKQKVELKGTIEQIMHAKELIDQCVRDENEFSKKKSIKIRESDCLIRNSSRQSFKAKADSCKTSQDSLSSYTDEAFSDVKQEIMRFPEDTDQTFKIYMSSVANPNYFWVQLVNDDTKNLDWLMREMSSFYENYKDNPLLFLDEIKIGSIVAAQDSEKTYNRAEILNIIDNDDADENQNEQNYLDPLLDVYMVDFGVSAFVRKSQLRKLKSKFNSLPFYAIKCTLHGIPILRPDEWDEKEIIFFEEITHTNSWKALDAKLVGFTDKYVPILELYDPIRNVNITEELTGKAQANSEDETVTHSF